MFNSLFETTKITAPLLLKRTEVEGGFSGYASVFNHLDAQGDRVLKGAFKVSLTNWNQKGNLPKMLWQHNQAEPLGYWKTLREDDKGLYVEGQLLLEVAKAKEAYALLKANILDGLSIGCQIIEAEKGSKPGERLLSAVELFEISLVTFAANSEAKITQVKEAYPNQSLYQKLETIISILKP